MHHADKFSKAITTDSQGCGHALKLRINHSPTGISHMQKQEKEEYQASIEGQSGTNSMSDKIRPNDSEGMARNHSLAQG